MRDVVPTVLVNKWAMPFVNKSCRYITDLSEAFGIYK